MDPGPISEGTRWQRSWPWLLGVGSLLLQGLTFTYLYLQLPPRGQVLLSMPTVLLPMGAVLLAFLREDAWKGRRVRYLRGAVLASSIVWCAISSPDFLEVIQASYNERGEPVSSSPQQVFATLQIPRLPVSWAFVFWGFFTGFGTVILTRIQDAKEEAARQRLNAVLAQDAALRARLAPHFIFNALNTLHAQIEHDPRGAQATTERLARLFRQVIQASEHATIPLKQELAFVEGYLGIEKARLGERLQVEIEVPEDLESQGIPPLSLQVLVENAIKHGVGSLEAGGRVRISARREDRGLILAVEDPGNGRGAGTGTGTALETLRARLARPQDLVLGPCEGGYRASFRWRQS